MLKRLLLAFAALLMLPTAAAAETLEGSWALRIDDTTIFRFDLHQSGEGKWQGVWARPLSFYNNGVIFSNLEGRYEVTSRDGRAQGDVVQLTFDNPRTRSLPDTLRFRVTGEGTAQFTYVDTGFAPFPLVRVAQGTEIGPFAQGRLYDRDSAQTEPTAMAEPRRAELAPAPEPGQELPAVSEADQGREPQAELPAVAPAVQTPEPETKSEADAAPAPRTAKPDGVAAPVAETPEPEAWQPDPAVSAAIAARAAALEGAGEPADAPEAKPEPESKPDSGLGADFLEGL